MIVAEAKVAVKMASEEHSFKVVEHYKFCHLDYCRFTVMQTQLDNLRERFHVLGAISMKAPRRGELF